MVEFTMDTLLIDIWSNAEYALKSWDGNTWDAEIYAQTGDYKQAEITKCSTADWLISLQDADPSITLGDVAVKLRKMAPIMSRTIRIKGGCCYDQEVCDALTANVISYGPDAAKALYDNCTDLSDQEKTLLLAEIAKGS